MSWSAVDMQGRELTIDQQLAASVVSCSCGETKTAASDGTLPIPDMVARALELRRADQEEDKAEAGEGWRGLPSGPHLVFTGEVRDPIDPRTLNRRLLLDATRPVSAT